MRRLYANFQHLHHLEIRTFVGHELVFNLLRGVNCRNVVVSRLISYQFSFLARLTLRKLPAASVTAAIYARKQRQQNNAQFLRCYEKTPTPSSKSVR